MTTRLRFVGDDGAFIRGVPARDLTDDDLKSLPDGLTAALLVKRGLYTAVKAAASDKSAKAAAAAPEKE